MGINRKDMNKLLPAVRLFQSIYMDDIAGENVMSF